MHEDSNTSYLGITESDFDDDPIQKYAAAQEDNMVSYQNQYELDYIFETEKTFLVARAYYRQFHRDWYKVNDLYDTTADDNTGLGSIVKDPTTYATELEYIKGVTDTPTNIKIRVRHNDRTYVSTGVQADGGVNFGTKYKSIVKYGLRYHTDGVKRDQTQDFYDMRSGRMANATQDADYSDKREYEATAISGYVQDTTYVNDFALSVGLRDEYITSDYPKNSSGESQDKEDSYNTVLPGGSILYNFSQEMNAFFGVHKGLSQFQQASKKMLIQQVQSTTNLDLDS